MDYFGLQIRDDVHISISILRHDFPHSSAGKASACNVGDLGSFPGREVPLEKEMATQPSILAWRIPRTEEPGRLQFMGLQVGHDLALSYT